MQQAVKTTPEAAKKAAMEAQQSDVAQLELPEYAVLMDAMVRLYAGDARRIQHFTKVFAYTQYLALAQGLAPDIQQTACVAALVHDIGIHAAEERSSTCNGPQQEQEGPPLARAMLEQLGYSPDVVERVCFLVGHHHTLAAVDADDFRILVEADFLVNLYEDAASHAACEAALHKVFRTPAGTALCRMMYGL